MKRKKLESLNLRLRKELSLSQQTCKVLREQLETTERKVLKLHTESKLLQNYYKAKKSDLDQYTRQFNSYVKQIESQAIDFALRKNIQLIKANKQACLVLFSKLQREYLFSLGGDQKAKKQDEKYLLAQMGNLLESL